VTTPADATLHIAFERDEDALGIHPQIDQRTRGETHHDFGPAEHRPRIGSVKTRVGQQCRDQPDPAVPLRCREVDGQRNLGTAGPPRVEVRPEDDLGRLARADEHEDAAAATFIGPHQFLYGSTKRGESDSSRDHNGVTGVEVGLDAGGLHEPVAAERAAHTDEVADTALAERVGYGADVSDAVAQRALTGALLIDIAISPTPNALSILN